MGCLLRGWPPSGPTGQVLPPSGLSLPGRARHLRAVPIGRLRRSRVLSAAYHCSYDTNDAGLVRGSWLQLRRLAGDYCSHSASRLVNGAWGPRKGRADCWRPTSLGSDWWGSSRLPGSRWSAGPVDVGPFRQAVVGTGLRPSVMTSRGEWQQCRAVRRSPSVRGTVATPGPGSGRDGLHCSHSLSCLS